MLYRKLSEFNRIKDTKSEIFFSFILIQSFKEFIVNNNDNDNDNDNNNDNDKKRGSLKIKSTFYSPSEMKNIWRSLNFRS